MGRPKKLTTADMMELDVNAHASGALVSSAARNDLGSCWRN